MEEQNSTKNSNEIVDEIKLEIEESQLDNQLSIDESTKIDIEESQLDKEDIKEEFSQLEKENHLEEEISKNVLEEDKINDYSIQKKQTKVHKILTIIIAILLVILTISIILYITGFFDKTEEPKAQPKVEEIKKEEKTFNFKSRDIDSEKLNKRFDSLTKYDPSLQDQVAKEEAMKKAKEEEQRKALEEKKRVEDIENLKKELEEQKKALEEKQSELISEKEQLVQMKEKFLQEIEEKKKELEIVKNSKEEQTQQTIQEVQTEENKMPPETMQQVVENIENMNNNSKSFLPLINISVIKGTLKKDYLQKIEKIDKNVLLCRDNQNNIEIYVGPYEMPSARNNLLNKFIDNGFNQAMLIDLTKEEFDKRCNY